MQSTDSGRSTSAASLQTFVSRHGAAMAMAALILLLLLVNRPDMRVRHFFFADDWAWLWRVEFGPIKQVFAWLPRDIYNDRPIGALFVMLLYTLFGLHVKAFLWVQLCVHVANCVLLALIAKKYVGRTAAITAAAMAGTWVVADTAVFWTAAAFDLLGAFFCLLSIWFWQWSVEPQTRRMKTVLLQILAAAAYYCAVRSKEFALALPALIYLFSFLLERRGIWQTIKDTWAILAVAALMALCYVALLLLGPQKLLGASDNLYGLHASGIGTNLWWYFSRALYFHIYGWKILGPVVLLVVAAFIAAPSTRRPILVGLAGFVIMLGPVLMLSSHLEVLYLYAPHFFLAFAISAAIQLGIGWRIAAVVVIGMLIIRPGQGQWHRNEMNFYGTKTAIARAQFESFNQIVGELTPDAFVAVSNVEPYQNPFDYGPGHSVRVSRHNYTMKFAVDTPEAPAKAQFCAATGQRYFIRFNGNQAIDVTAETARSCGQ